MMKKTALILIVSLVISGLAVSSVLAENSAVDSSVKARVGALKGQIEQVRETRQARIGRLSTTLVDKLTKVLGNVESLLAKVKDRLTKMETAGRDMTATKAKIPAAESAITSAKTAIEDLKTKLPSLAMASSTPKAIWTEAKTALQTVNQLVKQAHQAVVDIIRAIKPATSAN